jgi:multidrug transporter EmrE-like cation transporter
MSKTMAYLLVLTTIALGLYGQVVLKWQVNLAGAFPPSWPERAAYILRLLGNPWVLSSLAAAFVALLTWMLALSRIELSEAYPFLGLSFALVLAAGVVFLDEPLRLEKLLGVALIIAGIYLGIR